MTTIITPTSPVDLTPIQPQLGNVQALQHLLTSRLIERDDAVHAALLALLAREHLILIGPPGTAKSLLVTLLARAITDASGQGLPVFSYLMTRFTTPDDLFGPVSFTGLKQDRYLRITRGRLAEARLAFLDEVLRGNDASLESLLTVMNERLFDNDGERVEVPLISLFGATNDTTVPHSAEGKIGAVWDRFLLRVRVGYVSAPNFSRMLRLSPGAPFPASWTGLTLDDLEQLQQARAQVHLPAAMDDLLAQLRKELLDKKIVVSDRRWQQCCSLLQANALLAGRGIVEGSDLRVLKYALWQQLDQSAEMERIIVRLIAPFESEVLEILDQAESVVAALDATQHNSALSDQERVQASMEAMGKLRVGLKALEQLRTQMRTGQVPTGQIDDAVSELRKKLADVSEWIVSPTV